MFLAAKSMQEDASAKLYLPDAVKVPFANFNSGIENLKVLSFKLPFSSIFLITIRSFFILPILTSQFSILISLSLIFDAMSVCPELKF